MAIDATIQCVGGLLLVGGLATRERVLVPSTAVHLSPWAARGSGGEAIGGLF